MTVLIDEDFGDLLIEAMDDLSADLVAAVKDRDRERVAGLLTPLALEPLYTLAIAQAARIHVLTAGGAR